MHSAFLKQNWLGLSLIALTWLIFFWRVLFGGQVYFLDDLKILYYPIESVFAETQAAGQLPTWSHYFGFGHPALAWAQLGFFTPLHVLLRLLQLHPVVLLNVSTVVYVALGLIGMFVFLRSQKMGQLPAALGAIVFGFCGFVIGHLNHVNFYTAIMVLPWLLFAVSAFIRKPSLPRTAALALLAAIVPLSGQPQISLYTFIIAAIFGVVLVFSRGKLLITRYSLRIALLTGLAAVLSFSLASFSILPLHEFLPSSDRAADLPVDELYEFSYPLSHLSTLLDPYFFGDHAHYAGAKNFQELSAYVGFLPLALAVGGLLWPTRRFGALRLTSLVLLVLAALFATGAYSPIYHYLAENHIWPNLAVPGRFVYFFDVGVALLAAAGLEFIIGIRERSLTNSDRPGARVGRSNFVRLEASVATLIVAVSAANLIWWGWNYNPLTPRASALQPSPFTETLQQYERATGLPARLFAHETLQLSGPAFKKDDPRVDFYPETDTERDLLLRNIQAVAHASSGRWIGALSLEPYRTFVDKFFANDRDPFDGEGEHPLVRFRSLVNATGITHLAQALPVKFADRDPVLQNGYELVQESHVGENTLLRLYRNPQAFPKAYLVSTAVWESGFDQTRHAISHPDYNPANLVYISGPKPPTTGTLPNQEEPNPAAIPITLLENATANITRYKQTQVDIAVQTEQSAWLILTDSFAPQWQTFIDDTPAPQYVANTIFRAAQVPPGTHTVSFRYISPAIKQAKTLSSIGFVVTALCFAAPYFKRRVSSSVAS